MAATVRLARTRSLRRRPLRRWWWAALAAALLNAGAVAVLARLAGARLPAAAAAIPVRAIERAPQPDPDPPAEPATEEASAVPAPTPSAALPPLPALDLPALDQSLATALPPPAPVAVAPLAFDLPAVALPGLTAVAIPASGVGGAPADRPAEREGGWDLARFYPRSARRQGLRGTSILRLAIAADGAVAAVAVERSDPPGSFEDAARRLGRSLRYRPALRAGAPVASTLHLTIDWIPP